MLLRYGSAGDDINEQLIMSTNILLDFLGNRSNTNALGKGSVTLHRVDIHLNSYFIHRQTIHDPLMNFFSIETVLRVELRFANYIILRMV